MSGRHRRADPEEVPPPAPPVVTDPGVRTVSAEPSSRAALRAARAAEREGRRAARRRRLLLAAGVAAALAVVAGVALAFRGEDSPLPGGGGNLAAVPQQTMLLQVTGPDGVARDSVLLGVSEEAASAVLVPSGLLVDVAGTGSVPFGETAALPERSASAQALTDLAGVRVDDTWRLSTEGLARLVDAVGGIRAAVDVDVLVADAQGNQTVVVRAGSQQLRGAAAAAYATYLADGEPEQARLARFDDVLRAVAAALPDRASGVQGIVVSLGSGSESSLPPAALAARLGLLRSAALDEELVSDVLPVTEIDSGGAAPTYGVDAGQLGAMMRARFPGALQADSTGAVLRVLVENGLGTPGLVEQAREKLVAAGFRFVNGGNAAEFSDEPSSVIIPDGTEESVARGQRVAAALGLPETAIGTSDRGQTVADVIVILGSDFAP